MRYVHITTGENAEAWSMPFAGRHKVKTADGFVEMESGLFTLAYRPVPDRRVSERRARPREAADRRAIERALTANERLRRYPELEP